MKILTLTFAVCVTLLANKAFAVIVLCPTIQACATSCRNVSNYCCPNGKTNTTYTCPTGWIYNTTDKVCKRSNTTGSDTKGYYTQTYGTCNYTGSTTTDCYEESTTNKAGCSKCMQTIN